MKVVKTRWAKAVRIIRSIFPPIDLFEDIADPADWPAIMAAEQKTNPRLAERLGEVERVPPGRRVGGAGGCFEFGEADLGAARGNLLELTGDDLLQYGWHAHPSFSCLNTAVKDTSSSSFSRASPVCRASCASWIPSRRLLA